MKTLNTTKLKERIKWSPHPAQQKVLAEMEKYRWVSLTCGRRWGKSQLAGYIILKQLLLADKNIWCVAPSYELAKKSFTYIEEWAAKYFPAGTFKINQSTLTITGPFRSKLVAKSADNPTSLLGESLDYLVAEESARIKKEVYESYLRPCLSDRMGKALFISTPVSRSNWLYDLYVRGQDPENKEWISWQFPTSSNPYISKKDLEEAKATLPAQIYQREYEAVFTDDAYSVFRNVKECIDASLPRDYKHGHRHIIGIDLAKQRDYSVLVVIDRDTSEVIEVDRFSKLSYTIQKERIVNTYKKYPNCKIICDSLNVGGVMIDELRLMLGQHAVQPFAAVGTISADVKAKGSKNRMIEKLAQFIESGEIRLPDNKVLINELESFGMEITEKGNVRYSAPSGCHDDAVMALGLGVWLLESQDRKKRVQKRKQKTYEIRRQNRPRGGMIYR